MYLVVLAQYRANMAVWSLASILQIIVYMSVWIAVADARGGSTSGYTANTFAGYFLVLLIVRDMTMTWIPYDLPGQVRKGDLAPKLIRPFHPVLMTVADMFAFRVQSVLTVVPIAAVMFLVFDARIAGSVGAVLAAIALIPLASVTRALVDTLFASTSLWLVRIDGIRNLYYMLLLLLGGQFAPLALFPAWLQNGARALPFYWTLGYPTELAIGTAPLSEAWIGALVLTGWALVTFAVLQPVWRAGIRAHEAVGS